MELKEERRMVKGKGYRKVMGLRENRGMREKWKETRERRK